MLFYLYDGAGSSPEDEDVPHVRVNAEPSGDDVEHWVAKDPTGRNQEKCVPQDRLIFAMEAHLLNSAREEI